MQNLDNQLSAVKPAALFSWKHTSDVHVVLKRSFISEKTTRVKEYAQTLTLAFEFIHSPHPLLRFVHHCITILFYNNVFIQLI